MSVVKERIKRLSDQVKDAGLKGDDMNDVLAKVAEAEDLSATEIQRVAERANREVQLALKKTAGKQSFKFTLIDGQKIAASCTKKAMASTEREPTELEVKMAYSFEGPKRARVDGLLGDLSAAVSPATKFSQVDFETLKLADSLRTAAKELDELLKEAATEELTAAGKLVQTEEQMLNVAFDLLTSNITACSLYEAIVAGHSGSQSGIRHCDLIKAADETMTKILEYCKKRGVPNHQLGFCHKGDIDALESLTVPELLELCKRQSAYTEPSDLKMDLVKSAEAKLAAYTEFISEGRGNDAEPSRPIHAEQWLQNRQSQKIPQAYLDSPVRTNQPLIINTDHELIINVKDLVGAQDRLVKLHGAQEYLGLKLKEISEAMKDLQSSRAEAKSAAMAAHAAWEEAKKEAIAPLLMGAGRALASGAKHLVNGISKLHTGVASGVANIPQQGTGA